MFAIPDFAPECFVGRSEEIDRIRNHIAQGATRVAAISGAPGIGKTALANRLLQIAAVGSPPYAPTIMQSLWQEPWHTSLAQVGERLLGRDVVLQSATSQVLERGILEYCSTHRVFLVLDDLALPERKEANAEEADAFVRAWLKTASESILVVTSTKPLPISDPRLLALPLSGLDERSSLDLLGPTLRRRFGDDVLKDKAQALNGVPLNLLYLRWQNPESPERLADVVAGPTEGTLNLEKPLSTVLTEAIHSPTQFMALGLTRRLQFDESLLAFFWDYMGGGGSEAYTRHRDRLIADQLLTLVSSGQGNRYMLNEQVHKHLSTALEPRVGGPEGLRKVHYLASEYYRRVYERNPAAALDALVEFVHHCWASGKSVRAYKYIFENEASQREQQPDEALQFQVLRHTFREFDSVSARQVQAALAPLMSPESTEQLSKDQRCHVLVEMAHACSDLGDFLGCISNATQAEDLLRDVHGDVIGEHERLDLQRRIWYYLGVAHNNLGHSQECCQSYFRIVASSGDGDVLGCLCLGYLALDLMYRGAKDAARFAEAAVEMARQLKDERSLVKNLCNLGEILTHCEKYKESDGCFREGIDRCEKLPQGTTEKRERGRLWKDWGALALAQRDFEEARRRLANGRTISSEVGDSRRMASGDIYAGLLLHHLGERVDADRFLEDAVAMNLQMKISRYLVPAALTYARLKDPRYQGYLDVPPSCKMPPVVKKAFSEIGKDASLEVYARFWRESFSKVFL